MESHKTHVPKHQPEILVIREFYHWTIATSAPACSGSPPASSAADQGPPADHGAVCWIAQSEIDSLIGALLKSIDE